MSPLAGKSAVDWYAPVYPRIFYHVSWVDWLGSVRVLWLGGSAGRGFAKSKL